MVEVFGKWGRGGVESESEAEGARKEFSGSSGGVAAGGS